jgi:hypothetical protein
MIRDSSIEKVLISSIEKVLISSAKRSKLKEG